MFNKYFVPVAEQIGKCDELEYGDNITDITQTHATHQSVSYIRQNLVLREIEFTPVEQDQVFEKFKKLNERKATGNDGIPPKLIKMVALELSTAFTYLINMAFETSQFPIMLKCAEVTPLYKKDDVQ